MTRNDEWSLVYDPDITFRYRYQNPRDPDGKARAWPRTWSPESFVVLRRHRNTALLGNMARELTVQRSRYDADAERKRRRTGQQDYQSDVVTEQRKTGLEVTLEHGIVDWGGRSFHLPSTFCYPGTKNRHPLAGQEMPCTPEMIGYLPDGVTKIIEDVLDTLWKNPDAEDEEIFRLLGESPPESGEQRAG